MCRSERRIVIAYILKQKRNGPFSPSKDVKTKMKPKCLSNVRHKKIGTDLISSSYLEGLLNLI